MSNVGAGSAAVGVGALAIVPLVAVGLVVGAGVLCYKGVMYCGDQLDKQYAERNRAIAARKAAIVHAQLATVDTTQQYLKVEQRRMAAHAARLALEAPPPLEVAETAVSARRFINGGPGAAETLAQAENRYLRERLEAAIRVGSGKLPDDLMARASQSLTAPSSVIQSLLNEIDAAWKRAAAERNDQQYERPQLELRLRELRAWLTGLRETVADQQELDPTTYAADMQRISQLIDDAGQLPTAAAMGKLAPIEDELDAVADAIAIEVRAASERVGAAVSPLTARIENLASILQDAGELNDAGEQASHLLTPAQIAPLRAALTSLASRAEQIQATGTMKEVHALERDIADQERSILDLVKTTQQQRLAAIIQTTLSEQGFAQGPAAQPRPDGTLAMVGTRERYTDQGAADQRRVTFEVTRGCAISYDFSGYVGESCLEDARRVFTALAKKGIYILGDDDMRRLQEHPEVTASTLQDMVVQPTVNKRQAILSSKILEVLQEMGYQIIYRETIGDTVYFDASHDGRGFFSVSIDGKGDARVFTDRDHTQQIVAYSDDDLLQQLSGEEPGDEAMGEPSSGWSPDRTQLTE